MKGTKTKPKKAPPKAKIKGGKVAKKALTHKQQFQRELQAFEERVNDKLEAFRQALNNVMERTWKNIQLLQNGLQTAEAHVMMLRRVLDDGLNGAITTRPLPMTFKEVKDGVENLASREGKIVDWEHYTSLFLQEQARHQAAREAAENAAKAAQVGGTKSQTVPPELREQIDEKTEDAGAIEAKKEELAPPDDGLPEGASVFGGEGG